MFSVLMVLPLLNAPAPKVSLQVHHRQTKPDLTKEEKENIEFELTIARFPPYHIAHQWRHFACEYAHHIENNILNSGLLMTNDEKWRWQEYLSLVRAREQMWDLLEDATNPCYAVDYRRRRFNELRDLIGEYWYWMGYVPLPLEVDKLWLID